MRIRVSALRGWGSVSLLGQMQRLSIGGVAEVSQRCGASIGARPDIFQGRLGEISTGSLPSASSWLSQMNRTANRGFAIGSARLGEARPSNNAMHQTRREGAAGSLRRRPVVEARLAGDCEC